VFALFARKQQDVRGEGDVQRGQGAGAAGGGAALAAVCAAQQIGDGGVLEMMALADAELIDDGEVRGVFGDNPVGATAGDPFALHGGTQFDEIVGRRHGDEQVARPRQHTRTFGGMAPAVQREHEIDRLIEQRQPAIGIRHHPGQCRKTPCGVFGRGDGQIDADADDLPPCADRRDRVTRPGAQVGDDRLRRKKRQHALHHAIDQCLADAGSKQPRAGFDRLTAIARITRLAVLRLQQRDVARTRDIVGVTARAYEGSAAALEQQPAVTNGASQRRRSRSQALIVGSLLDMTVRRLHRVIGVAMLLPFAGWAMTGFVFFVKPGYGGAYEALTIKTYPLEHAVTIAPRPDWREFRVLRTVLGTHLLVRTDAGWQHLRADTLQPAAAPDPSAVRTLIGDAFADNPARYGHVVAVRGATVETDTGARVTLDWNHLQLQQRGRDTDWIDALYRVHYLQWTSVPTLDKILGFTGLTLLLALTAFGATLAFRR
jgi:hypothetical protein